MFQYFVGTIREILIAIDAIQVFLAFQISVIFIFRVKKTKSNLKINLGWFLVFLCLGILALLSVYKVYYLSEDFWIQYKEILTILGYIPIISIIFVFEILFQQYKKTKYIYTLIGICVNIPIIILFPFLQEMFINFYIAIFFFFTVSFFYKLIKLSTGLVRIYIIIFVISFYSLMVGNILADPSRYNISFFSSDMIILLSLLGKLLQISSIIIISAVLFRLPIFFEVNWKESLIQIFIIKSGAGISFFNMKFQRASGEIEGRSDIDEELVGGGMVGITTMLKEISRSSEELKTIDHGDQKILLEHSEYFFIALLVKVEMHIFKEKLFQLRSTIEKYYNNILEDWDGSLDYFEPLGNIVKDIFQ